MVRLVNLTSSQLFCSIETRRDFRLVNLTKVWPQNTQLGEFEAGALPILVVDAQLGDHNQTTTNILLKRLKRLHNQAKIAEKNTSC